MKEIVKVKHDHGILYARIPKSFVKDHKITRKDYLVWNHDATGRIRLEPLNLESKNGAKNRTSEG